jgi:hypothetical protein
MNKYFFFLRILPISLSLLAMPLAYGIQDGDLNDNGIPDSQENSQGNTGAQSQPLSKKEYKAAKKKAKRERKAQKLERKAVKKEKKGKTEKATKLRQKAQAKRDKNQETSGVMNDNNNNGIPDDVE